MARDVSHWPDVDTGRSLDALVGLYNKPDLPEDTRLFWRITQHAGSEILPGVSSYMLVATHVFLETIHYAAWILIIPLIDTKAIPWKFYNRYH